MSRTEGPRPAAGRGPACVRPGQSGG